MTRLTALVLLPLIAFDATLAQAQRGGPAASESAAHHPRVVVNDNRHAAGTLHAGVLTLKLDTRLGEWHPDGEDAIGATVPAFAEESKPVRIPGPLIRVPVGTALSVSIRNSLAQPLTVRGLHDRRAGYTPSATDGIVELAPGSTQTGADLPPAQLAERRARSGITIGETMDYEFVPTPGTGTRIEVRALNGILLSAIPITVVSER